VITKSQTQVGCKALPEAPLNNKCGQTNGFFFSTNISKKQKGLKYPRFLQRLGFFNFPNVWSFSWKTIFFEDSIKG